MTQQFPTVDILRYLLRFKWWFLGLVAVTTVAAYAYARTLPEYFKATINCVPPSQQMGGMGNIMNMVKEMGNMEGMQEMMQQMMGGAGGGGMPGLPAGMNLNALAGMMGKGGPPKMPPGMMKRRR